MAEARGADTTRGYPQILSIAKRKENTRRYGSISQALGMI
jgi:hypothetical protein